jgi:Leucine-rich repeat (LRR) protein
VCQPEMKAGDQQEKKDLLSEINQQIVEEERETKLHNTKYRAEGEPIRPHVVEASRKPDDLEVTDLFHGATTNNSIDTFVKRKYVSMRKNMNLGMNSPDIILFKECLRMNVLPPGSLDMQKSSDMDLNNSYDPSVSTRQLALITSTLLGKANADTGSIADVGMQSHISFPDDGTAHGQHESHAPLSSAQSIGSIDSTDVIGVENEQIVSINLNNRSIGNERGICLSAALSYCPHLVVIRLSNNRLTDRSLSMILKAVFNISYCEELDVSCNGIGDLSTACLEQYLAVSVMPLLSLYSL